MNPKHTQQQQHKPNEYGVYMKQMLAMKVFMRINEVGTNTRANLEHKIVQRTEGKCVPEGYIRPRTVRVIKYSAGIVNSEYIEFQAVYECMVCNPVEGMKIECDVVDITMAGIHAVVPGDIPGKPLIEVFIARDHNYLNRNFGNIKEGMKIEARIIGKRFELNDPCITVGAMLMEDRAKPRPKLMVHEEEPDLEESGIPFA